MLKKDDIVMMNFDPMDRTLDFYWDTSFRIKKALARLYKNKSKFKIIGNGENSDYWYKCVPVKGRSVYDFYETELTLVERKRIMVKDFIKGIK